MKRIKARLVAVLLVAALAAPRPAGASIFGEENVLLGKIAAQQLRDSVQFMEALNTMHQTLTIARKTAGAARDAVQVVENVAMIVQDPVGYLKANGKLFLDSFPEIQALRNEVRGIKETLRRIRFDGRFDPYATLEVLETIETGSAAFHAMVEILDEWEISDPHNEMMAYGLEVQSRAASVQAAINTEQRLTPQEAQVLGAQAAAVSAEANAQIALLLNDMVKAEKIRFANEFANAMRTRATWLEQLESMVDASEDHDFSMPLAPRPER